VVEVEERNPAIIGKCWVPILRIVEARTVEMGLGRVKTFRLRETGDGKLNLACCHNYELESS
jgi:hypothetical protein